MIELGALHRFPTSRGHLHAELWSHIGCQSGGIRREMSLRFGFRVFRLNPGALQRSYPPHKLKESWLVVLNLVFRAAKGTPIIIRPTGACRSGSTAKHGFSVYNAQKPYF